MRADAMPLPLPLPHREGTLRAKRITTTGRMRDTVLFSILADERAARR